MKAQGLLLTCVVAIIAISMWYLLCRVIRNKVVGRLNPKRSEASEEEAEEAEEAEEEWEDTIEETENDGFALTISFMLCQLFRFLITDSLPDVEGNEARGGPAETGPLETTHDVMQIALLVACGVGLFAVVALFKELQSLKELKEKIFGEKRAERIDDIAAGVGSMGFAWTVFYAVIWFLDFANANFCHPPETHGGFNCGSGGMAGSVLVALAVTLLSYSMILFCRHKARFMAKSDKYRRAFMVMTLQAQGLLIGFSWEKSFDTAVEDVSSTLPEEVRSWAKLGMSMFVCGIVMIIWMWHVMPVIVEGEVADQNRDELIEKFNPKDAEGKPVDPEQLKKAHEEYEEKCAQLEAEFEKSVLIARDHILKLRKPELRKKIPFDLYGAKTNSGGARGVTMTHLRKIVHFSHEMAEHDIEEEGLFSYYKKGKEGMSEELRNDVRIKGFVNDLKESLLP